jgi:hypothetical protein
MQNSHKEHAETLYYHIAGDALKHAQATAKKGNDEFRLAQYVCASMVFSALTLEAYVNQEYASHTQTKTLDIKKPNTVQKWIRLPRLLGGAETFNKREPPFKTFNELIKLRNDLFVHFRGGPIGKILDEQGEIFAQVVKDVTRAETYFHCIDAMISKLNELSLGQTSLPGFLKGERYLASFSVTSPLRTELTAGR